MKLHLGCGDCYLEGFINIDAAPTYLTSKAPKDLLDKNKTTYENYYKHEFGQSSKVVIADIATDIKNIPYNDETIDQVVMIHVLEHFPIYDVNVVLREINRVLKNDGEFIVGVPDLVGNAKLLLSSGEQGEDWVIRLIDGTQKNKFFHHYCSFTKRTLKKLLSENGFGYFQDLPNINFYPAIHILAKKI